MNQYDCARAICSNIELAHQSFDGLENYDQVLNSLNSNERNPGKMFLLNNNKGGTGWKIGKSYKEGDIVSYQNKLYISNVNNNTGMPTSASYIKVESDNGNSYNGLTIYNLLTFDYDMVTNEISIIHAKNNVIISAKWSNLRTATDGFPTYPMNPVLNYTPELMINIDFEENYSDKIILHSANNDEFFLKSFLNKRNDNTVDISCSQIAYVDLVPQTNRKKFMDKIFKTNTFTTPGEDGLGNPIDVPVASLKVRFNLIII